MRLNESLNISFGGLSLQSIRENASYSKLSRQLKWRILTLTLMGVTLVLLTVATMSTGWREDQEHLNDVFTTHGLWRVCRDIRFGSTVDHQCAARFANEAPSWFQTVRAFMLIALLLCFTGFFYGIYLIARLTPTKNRSFKSPGIYNSKAPKVAITFAVPGFLYIMAAVCVFVGSGTYSIATAMSKALYFPENLPPTWANSWAEVLAIRNSIPSELLDITEMEMKYGYSFGLAWFSLITTLASGTVCFIGSVP